MEIYETDNLSEKILRAKAESLNIPLGGAIELLPLCNMNCNMCYIRHDVSELEQPILRKNDWIRIASEAKEAGTVFLLITGGEPLLHPDFKEIYLALQNMGFIITINTNGTLIDEEWADFFKKNPCRRLNISLYGACNDTYEKLCHNPNGFTQVINAIEMLLQRDIMIRLNFSLVKDNRNEIKEMVNIANKYNIPFIPATYMFPPKIEVNKQKQFYQSRMTPMEAAETRLEATILRNPQTNLLEQARLLLEKLEGPCGNIIANEGFTCSAARSGYWINWKGDMLACGMIDILNEDLQNNTFLSAWNKIVSEVKKLSNCNECNKCRKKFFCQSCAASSFIETGDFHKKSEYLCEVTDNMIKILINQLPVEEQKMHIEKLNSIGIKL